MRIGAVYEWKPNIRYRTQNPLEALARRGHELVLSKEGDGLTAGRFDPRRLAGCDVIHGYRLIEAEELRAVDRLVRGGAAFVWDTDDDLSSVPKESPYYRSTGGLRGQHTFSATVAIARRAHVATTSTEALAARYRAAGVEHVEVLGNYLAAAVARSRRQRHEGIVIGWTAGLEHASELPRMPLVAALRRLLDEHPDVRVETIGLDLRLPSDRYTCKPLVQIERLQEHLRSWDVGIAPLADIPFNRARSDVKLKEYASAGLAWLASPVGPYAGYGEGQGGRLVAETDWHGALDRLVRKGSERRRLARRGRSWAKSQSIERFADRWERVLETAMQRRATAGA